MTFLLHPWRGTRCAHRPVQVLTLFPGLSHACWYRRLRISYAINLFLSIPGTLPVFWEKRYIPFGTHISKRAPCWNSPVSFMVIFVIDRISRERNSPRPVFLPNPFWKIVSLSCGGIPMPSSSILIKRLPGISVADSRTTDT